MHQTNVMNCHIAGFTGEFYGFPYIEFWIFWIDCPAKHSIC